MHMNDIELLSKKYNFDYGFANDFNDSFEYIEEYLSDVAVVNINPEVVLKGCKTVVVLAFKHDNKSFKSNLASFGWGDDYHNRIVPILDTVKKCFNNSVAVIDSNEINERYFASKSGIGFIGKNSQFINRKFGSYCNIALILTTDYIATNDTNCKTCGSCNKCIKACPADAIERQINCKLCISERLQSKKNLDFINLGNNIYGCDICQIVCPHNKLDEEETKLESYIDYEKDLFLSKSEYIKYKNKVFHWIGYRSYMRNIHYLYVKNSGDFSKLSFLDESNSEYLNLVARELRRQLK